MLYRRGRRQLAQEDTAGARSTAEEMLVLYPESWVAYHLLGEVARRHGRDAEAAAAAAQADELTRSGRDQLHAQRMAERRRWEVRDAIEGER
jgi:Flp pilus assembly protein TadD